MKPAAMVFSAFILLLSLGAPQRDSAQQQERTQLPAAPGASSSTPMLFEVLPNFHVVETEAVELDFYTFGYLPGTPRIEGRRTTTSYGLNPGSPMPGALGICRHFANATRQAGGEILYDNDRNIITVRLKQRKQETWAEFACDKDRYRVNIIERESNGGSEQAANVGNIMKTKHDTAKNSTSNIVVGAGRGKVSDPRAYGSTGQSALETNTPAVVGAAPPNSVSQPNQNIVEQQNAGQSQSDATSSQSNPTQMKELNAKVRETVRANADKAFDELSADEKKQKNLAARPAGSPPYHEGKVDRKTVTIKEAGVAPTAPGSGAISQSPAGANPGENPAAGLPAGAPASAALQPQKPATQKAASSAAPSGWQVVKDHDGKCQFSVPDDWAPVAGFGMASSARLKARAAVQKDSENRWSELKQTAKEILKPTKILEDSASRFSFEYSVNNGKGFYLARPFAGFACIAQVDFDSPDTAEKNGAIARQMVESVDKAH